MLTRGWWVRGSKLEAFKGWLSSEGSDCRQAASGGLIEEWVELLRRCTFASSPAQLFLTHSLFLLVSVARLFTSIKRVFIPEAFCRLPNYPLRFYIREELTHMCAYSENLRNNIFLICYQKTADRAVHFNYNKFSFLFI